MPRLEWHGLCPRPRDPLGLFVRHGREEVTSHRCEVSLDICLPTRAPKERAHASFKARLRVGEEQAAPPFSAGHRISTCNKTSPLWGQNIDHVRVDGRHHGVNVEEKIVDGSRQLSRRLARTAPVEPDHGTVAPEWPDVFQRRTECHRHGAKIPNMQERHALARPDHVSDGDAVGGAGELNGRSGFVHHTTPCSRAQFAASTRFALPVFSKMWRTWVATVASLSVSSSAI